MIVAMQMYTGLPHSLLCYRCHNSRTNMFFTFEGYTNCEIQSFHSLHSQEMWNLMTVINRFVKSTVKIQRVTEWWDREFNASINMHNGLQSDGYVSLIMIWCIRAKKKCGDKCLQHYFLVNCLQFWELFCKNYDRSSKLLEIMFMLGIKNGLWSNNK